MTKLTVVFRNLAKAPEMYTDSSLQEYDALQIEKLFKDLSKESVASFVVQPRKWIPQTPAKRRYLPADTL